MLPHASGAKVILPPQYATAGVTNSVVVDTSGADALTFDLIIGTHGITTGNYISTCKWAESDDSTDVSSMTDIVALTGGTSVVSGSTGWIWPPSSSIGRGAVFQFNIDLRKRKKYIALLFTGCTLQKGGWVAGVGTLSNREQSADTPYAKSLPTRYDDTNASGCSVVVTV